MNEREPRIFVTTDSHGCNKELCEVLELSEFKRGVDTLIHIGDCTDRGPDSYGVIETLLSIPNLIAIQGNHDYHMKYFIETGYHPWEHKSCKTIESYINSLELEAEGVYWTLKWKKHISTNFEPRHMPKTHRDFFLNQLPYYIDGQNRLFVHGGYDPMMKIEEQSPNFIIWDRDLVQHLGSFWEDNRPVSNYPDINCFKRVFIGHTPTITFKKKTQDNKLDSNWLPSGALNTKPMYLGQLVNLDTGCVFGGKLSLIDITNDEEHILYQNT